ncbi:MAG TPA: HD domain-containing phosphohydrolase [Gemmatimonadales bacterium]|nr:HD domain-containing phosphohydrolase [Gemmatimonadales bacterium]
MSSSVPEPRFPDARFLVVDDDDAMVRALVRILKSAGYVAIRSTTDGTSVPELFRAWEPDLVLLDLHMPARDGVAVLEDLRAVNGPQNYLPVLILTGDPSLAVRQRALAAGATDFVTKPFDVHELLLRIRNLLEARYLHRENAAHNQLLEARVAERTAELDDAYLDTLERLAMAAEFRDDETGRHTERVGEAAAVLAHALGLPETDVFYIRRAAPLHDVGKIGIPDAILRKPGPLTEAEWRLMREHTTIGARILSRGRSPVIRLAEEIALYHHEHWNGLGYPNGLAGERIPLVGRLVMVADVFDALLSDRSYRSAWPVEQVLQYIHDHAGRRFDPRIARLCDLPEVRRALLAIRSPERRSLAGTGLSSAG